VSPSTAWQAVRSRAVISMAFPAFRRPTVLQHAGK
jgi:hypothetical protein